MIPRDHQKQLWGYLAGISKRLKVQPMAIGGISDHVHMLVAMPGDLDISEFVNKLKSNSSKWMKQHRARFMWQKGFGSFSVSFSNLASVARYIVA